MHLAFRRGGRKAIEKVMRNQPAVFLKLLVLLVPRQMTLDHSGGIKAMTDEQIERSIAFIKEQLAKREAGANAKVIEGVVDPEQFRSPQRCGRADIGGDDARMFENIAWCAFGKRASIIKHVDAIGKVRHHLEVMLDPDHGNSKFVLDAQNKTRQVLALVAIEPRRRFVEHQNRRLQSERARKPY